MLPELTSTPLFPFAVIFGVLGVLLIFFGILSFWYLQFSQSAVRIFGGLLLLSLGALAGTVSVGMLGYRALTREDVAARITVKPAGAKRFEAMFRFADGRQATYQLAGDELYVDAHILKWHPYANMIGLHTVYELDRVAGRYADLASERTEERTVHRLGQEKAVDLFHLRRRFSLLRPLVDAEYGSASFVAVTQPAELELRRRAAEHGYFSVSQSIERQFERIRQILESYGIQITRRETRERLAQIRRSVAEEVSGLDLKWLFGQWLHGTPLIDYELTKVERKPLANGQWLTAATVSRRGYGRMPLEIGDAERIYALLADRGEIFMKLEKTHFANRFAMLRDRFGTSWMLLHQPETE